MTPTKKASNPFAPPAHLSDSMKRWWRDLNKTFAFEVHQLKILRVAAEAYDRAQEARAVLAKKGLTYTDRFGSPKPRPEVGIERDSRISFARLVRELSLTEPPPDEATRPPRIGRHSPKGRQPL
jgi:phage terminase small subunit